MNLQRKHLIALGAVAVVAVVIVAVFLVISQPRELVEPEEQVTAESQPEEDSIKSALYAMGVEDVHATVDDDRIFVAYELAADPPGFAAEWNTTDWQDVAAINAATHGGNDTVLRIRGFDANQTLIADWRVDAGTVQAWSRGEIGNATYRAAITDLMAA